MELLTSQQELTVNISTNYRVLQLHSISSVTFTFYLFIYLFYALVIFFCRNSNTIRKRKEQLNPPPFHHRESHSNGISNLRSMYWT